MSCPMRAFKYIVPLKWVYYNNKMRIHPMFYLLRGDYSQKLEAPFRESPCDGDILAKLKHVEGFPASEGRVLKGTPFFEKEPNNVLISATYYWHVACFVYVHVCS